MGANTDLRRYLAILLQWSWFLLLVAALAGATAYTISMQQLPVYQASTTVLIDEAPGTNSTADYQSILTSERRARTYAQLLLTEPLLSSVAQQLNLSLPVEDLKDAISVQSVRDTQLIQVRARHTDPEQAAQLANTLITTFSEQTQQLQTSRYADSKKNLQDQMEAVEEQIQQAEASLETLERDDTALRQRLETSLAQSRQSHASLLQSYEQIRLAEAQSTSSIIQVEPAGVPTTPVGPRALLNAALAAIVAGMLAGGGVFLKEALDDRVKDTDLLSKVTGLPVLGSIVRVAKSDKSGAIVATEPRSPVAEAYRTLRTNLQFSSVDRPLRTILVTSPLPSEGKSKVSVNLAIVLAQAGRRVVLIDADLRRPVVHERLDMLNRSGLSDLFIQPHLNESVRPTDIKGMAVLTAGPVPPNPAELVGSEKMSTILQQVQEQADIVVIDAPPVLPVTDAAVLAQRVDGVLLVVRDGQTKVAACQQALEQLHHVGANVIGLVVNDIRVGRLRYGNRQYSQYYRYDNDQKTRRFGLNMWFGRKSAQAQPQLKEEGSRITRIVEDQG